MSEELRYTVGSGNIYADLGFDDPEDEATKAKLARTIGAIIRERKLTQVQAAKILGIDQPKISALMRGRLGNFSTDRLMKLLTKLDQDIDIVVQPKDASRPVGRIMVTHPAYANSGGYAMTVKPAKKGKTNEVQFS